MKKKLNFSSNYKKKALSKICKCEPHLNTKKYKL